MSSIQQFVELPSDMQQEVLDFMDYIRARRGIDLNKTDSDQPRWLAKVNRGPVSGEKISDSIIRERSEERW